MSAPAAPHTTPTNSDSKEEHEIGLEPSSVASGAAVATNSSPLFAFQSESYRDGLDAWPSRGRHILAQFHAPGTIRAVTGDGDGAILVYQAFNREIGTYAVEHQTFAGCPGFRLNRMTWVKTNFLWMMYRSNWCKKHSQAMVLGIWIRTSFFEKLLLKSTSTQDKGTKAKQMIAKQKEFASKLKQSKHHADSDSDDDDSDDDDWGGVNNERNMVCRHQWDPDHRPDGEPVVYRKALQIGMKGALLQEYAQTTNAHSDTAVKNASSTTSSSTTSSTSSDATAASSSLPLGPILTILDVTPFVIEQRKRLAAMKRADKAQPYKLLVARERVYSHLPEAIRKHVQLDVDDEAHQTTS